MISVCMTTYNGELFLKEQIDSILLQLSIEDELIISDDGSTDRTLEIIKSYNDERIKVLHHIAKKSRYYKKSRIPIVSFNFENALTYTKGEYIFLSDQDDVWYPNKIKDCMNELRQYDCILSNFSIIDDGGKKIVNKYYDKNPVYKSILGNIINPHFIGCCLSFNRMVLEKSLPFPRSVCSHDLWIGLVSTKFGHISFIDSPLIYHRVGKYNTSKACAHSENSLFVKIMYRVFSLFEILRR